jgi:hypothetical protein
LGFRMNEGPMQPFVASVRANTASERGIGALFSRLGNAMPQPPPGPPPLPAPPVQPVPRAPPSIGTPNFGPGQGPPRDWWVSNSSDFGSDFDFFECLSAGFQEEPDDDVVVLNSNDWHIDGPRDRGPGDPPNGDN